MHRTKIALLKDIFADEMQWPFWTKLAVVIVGLLGGIAFLYVQLKVKIIAYDILQRRVVERKIARHPVVLRSVPCLKDRRQFGIYIYKWLEIDCRFLLV